jgi:hypothetical protein
VLQIPGLIVWKMCLDVAPETGLQMPRNRSISAALTWSCPVWERGLPTYR